MTNSIKRKNSGFTIVELLIVIVVIAILAAISIVAYNGIQNRSRTTAANAAAKGVADKATVYATDGPDSMYPTASSDLTGAGAAGTTYEVKNVSFDGTTLATGNLPASPSELNLTVCGTNDSAAATNLGEVTVATGVQVGYWDYSAAQRKTIDAGSTSGTSAGGYNITCYLSS